MQRHALFKLVKKNHPTLALLHPENFKTKVSLEVTLVMFAGELYLRVPSSEKT